VITPRPIAEAGHVPGLDGGIDPRQEPLPDGAFRTGEGAVAAGPKLRAELGIGVEQEAARFLGPAQAASRSMMARLAPRELMTEFFGLYALAGKATAFVGPAVLGWVTVLADSQRIGMATILPFFIVGLWLILGVREDVRAAPTPVPAQGG